MEPRFNFEKKEIGKRLSNLKIRISKNIYFGKSNINKDHANMIVMKLKELKARLIKYKQDRMAGAMKYASGITMANQEIADKLLGTKKK